MYSQQEVAPEFLKETAQITDQSFSFGVGLAGVQTNPSYASIPSQSVSSIGCSLSLYIEVRAQRPRPI